MPASGWEYRFFRRGRRSASTWPIFLYSRRLSRLRSCERTATASLPGTSPMTTRHRLTRVAVERGSARNDYWLYFLDDDRPRELFVLAVNLVVDIDAEANPPDVA